jgi:hypothetical protein
MKGARLNFQPFIRPNHLDLVLYSPPPTTFPEIRPTLAVTPLHSSEGTTRHDYNRWPTWLTILCFLTLPNLAHRERLHVAMRLFHAITAVQLLAARLVVAVPLDSPSTPAIDIDPSIDPLDALAQLQQHAYDTLEQDEVVSKRAPKGCSLANTSIRRDW